MDLSIAIVSYNTQEVLKTSLKSVQIATKNIKSEVFVVDNDSKDQTVEMIKADFPWVKLIANKDNLGFSKANNQALKKTTGKYVLILNPDTEVLPDTLTTMIKFMDDNPSVGISTCRVELPNGQMDKDCRRHFPTPWRSFTHFSGLSKVFKSSKIFDQYYVGYIPDTKEHQVDSCVGAFMMIRKADLDKVGLFDEDFFFYGEDLDLCFRFGQKGYKVVFTPITKIIHHKGVASGMKKSSQHISKATKESKRRALYESVHSMEIFYKKHYISKYPFFINWVVILSLKFLEKIRVMSA